MLVVFRNMQVVSVYASCVTQYASCVSLYPSCVTQYANCVSQYAICVTQYASCVSLYASCFTQYASCVSNVLVVFRNTQVVCPGRGPSLCVSKRVVRIVTTGTWGANGLDVNVLSALQWSVPNKANAELW